MRLLVKKRATVKGNKMMKKQCFKVEFGLLAGGTIPLDVGAKTIKKTL